MFYLWIESRLLVDISDSGTICVFNIVIIREFKLAFAVRDPNGVQTDLTNRDESNKIAVE